MEQALTDEQLISLLDVLEEGEKSFTQASYRDVIMTAHTDMFFELGVRDVATMDVGWKAFKGLQNNFQGGLTSIYSKFRAGTVTTAGATTEFQTLLRKYGKDAFMAGTQMVGNKYYSEVGMTKKDLAFVNKYVRAETRHFRKFLNDIKDPKHLPANKIPRNKLGRRLPGYRQQIHPYAKRIGYYADSLRSMGFNGMVAGAGTLLNITWVLDKLSGRRSPHCEDCIIISAGNPYSWQTLPTTPQAGDTQCLFRCYCGLELQQRKGRGKEFDIPGSGSAQGLAAPGRWVRIFDKFGRPISGAPLQDIEDIYQQMYRARQMITITRGQERLNWIRTRQQLNGVLINQYPQYRKIPLVSVKDLTKAVLKAQPKGGTLIKNFVGIGNGEQVTFLRGNYFANGKLIRRGSQFIFKDASGVELIANLETDVIWSLKDIGFGKADWRAIAKKIFDKNKLTSIEIKALNEAMQLTSVSGQAVLKRLGITRMEVLEKIAKAREQLLKEVSTHKRYFNEATQTWAKERAILHDKIIKDFLAKVKASQPGEAEFIMTGGRPGSGKSTVLNKTIPGWKGKYIRVDSDLIKQMLAEADGYSTLGFRADLYHMESNVIAKKIMDLARLQNKNILFDQTMKNSLKAEYWVKDFKKAGYKVKGIFAELPPDKAIERAIYRFLKEDRFVDPAYIITHGTKNLTTFNRVKKHLDAWYHYNTDVPFGTDPILIAKWEKAISAAIKKVTSSETYIKRAVFVDGRVPAGTVGRLKKSLLKLPKKHLSYLNEVHLQDWSQFSYGGGKWSDAAYYRKSTGNIYVKNMVQQTVFHEVGHRVWYKGMTAQQSAWWIKRFDLMQSGKLIGPSRYGYSNVREFFAECYGYYFAPSTHRIVAPEIRKWFRNNF